MIVFLNKKGDGFYTTFDDEIYGVFLENPDQKVKLLTAKNGSKYFIARLLAKRSQKGKYYFVALEDKEEDENKNEK